MSVATLTAAKERFTKSKERAEELAGRAETWTAREADEFERLVRQCESIGAQIRDCKSRLVQGANSMTITSANTLPGLDSSRAGESWINARTGERLPLLRAGERFSSHNDGEYEFGANAIGRLMRGLVTNDWKHEKELYNALSTTGGGHHLVPDELGTMVIDLARANAVTMAAGAGSVEMDSDRLVIARVATDPSFEVKTENVKFTASDPTFDAVGFTARTLGTVVKVSRELAMDAPNFPSLIESIMGRALGVELDRLALTGNGGGDGVNGVVNINGIGTTGSVAAIAWEDFHTAAVAIRGLNHEPNAYIVHPTIGGDLDIITSGDGTNSAKLWLGPPPSLSNVQRFETTSLAPESSEYTAIVGDFREMLFGFRTQAVIESSTVAGDAFEAHQVWFKITLRFDVNVQHPAAFHSLTGITTS